ncbi:MAG: trypsin-like peptidase domain-containing protein, partial [Paludibacteraceae bacterium]|nr:trypsin-like peptidase domain-containing protein [Paludibacteraceae bacterium]
MKRIFIVLLAFLPFIASADIWTGTGFALNNGYVVTNNHVVDGANTLLVSMVRNDVRKSYVAEVVATDAINDVAVIKITDKNFKGFGAIPYRVRTSLAEVGEDCFVLGYPMVQHMGTEVKLTNGIVSSRSGYQGDKSTYQITAPIQHGNSGGPLFDAQGNVIGITSSGITEAQNVGYAIKTSFLRNLIESELSVNPMPSNNTIANLNLAGKVKILKNFVFIILASDEYSYEYTEGTATTSPRPSATKGTHNGHEWVDLGLSVKWATCNVGASTPEGYGNYYAWGETTTKSAYDSSTYTYSS